MSLRQYNAVVLKIQTKIYNGNVLNYRNQKIIINDPLQGDIAKITSAYPHILINSKHAMSSIRQLMRTYFTITRKKKKMMLNEKRGGRNELLPPKIKIIEKKFICLFIEKNYGDCNKKILTQGE